MIIKIMPENDAERAKMQAVEHTGVKEFFIFGNKKDADGELIDFHDWSGSYRYIGGSLHYFTNLLEDDRRAKSSNPPTEIQVNAAPKLIQMPTQKEALVPVPFTDENYEKMIKKSGAEDGTIEGVVEIANDTNDTNDSNTPNLKIVGEEEMAVEEDAANDSSKGAEDF